jgi:prepilin-type N-terminal cleavage/methylation domain-containing protein
MLRRNSAAERGFTLVELMIVIVLIGIISGTMFLFFNNTFSQYFALQKDGSNFTNLATQSQRIGNVLRGLTDIISETSDDLVVYAYFAPSDTYVSQIHYYENADNTKLMADVTHMTANPPIGTLITSSEKTYTIIPNFYQASGVNLFTYLDASSNALTLPIADEHTIKAIQVNLAAQTSRSTTDQTMSLQVSLRNRKTNL